MCFMLLTIFGSKYKIQQSSGASNTYKNPCFHPGSSLCVLPWLLNNAHSQSCRPASGGRWEGGGITSQKAPFPNPHKLHITWLQWDDYTLLARILWRLLTEPHYIDAHLWLNGSTSFLFSPAWPASHYCSKGETVGGGGGGGQKADQVPLRLADCVKTHFLRHF